MSIVNFETEKAALDFMSECMEWNNQGTKRVLYNYASREDIPTESAWSVWFSCPNDEIDEDGETLEEYLTSRACEIEEDAAN